MLQMSLIVCMVRKINSKRTDEKRTKKKKNNKRII